MVTAPPPFRIAGASQAEVGRSSTNIASEPAAVDGPARKAATRAAATANATTEIPKTNGRGPRRARRALTTRTPAGTSCASPASLAGRDGDAVRNIPDESTVAHRESPRGSGCKSGIVRCDDDRDLMRRGEAGENIDHVGARRGVEIPGRLVRQDHARVDHERARDRDALLLPSGEMSGEM